MELVWALERTQGSQLQATRGDGIVYVDKEKWEVMWFWRETFL